MLAQLEATRMTVVAAAAQLEAMVTALADEPEEQKEPRCPTCGSDGAVAAGRNAAGRPELLCPNSHSFVAREAA